MAMWFGDPASLLRSLPSNLGKGLVISTYERRQRYSARYPRRHIGTSATPTRKWQERDRMSIARRLCCPCDDAPLIHADVRDIDVKAYAESRLI